MASSSSSRQQNQGSNAFSGIEPDGKRRKVCESSRSFEVFINHRGPDVKQTLATELYVSLKELGIPAFLDSEEKELGYSFPSTIERAIKSASVHIAIFSKRYAESPWCLAELVLMSQTNARIIPVFYEVKPWELRFIEKGEYAEAFTKYVNEKRYLEKLPEWKEALQSLSFVTGEEFNGDCKNIIAAVRKELQKKKCLHVATYPVGLNNLVEDFERRCLHELVQDFENQCRLEEGNHKAKVVGIFGMGGVGKTTLAKELFNRKHLNYCRASFLFDVREASVTGQIPSLQLKLLKDLFLDHHLNFTSIEEGRNYLYHRLQSSPLLSFLIIVDDIDDVEQLNALMIMDILNKFGNTLVIVTTRDVGVLITAGITDGYNLKGMDKNNGRELFCSHAFRQPHSCSGYEELVDDFVDVCGGLPLSLQVLGGHVRDRPDSFWRSALNEAKKTLPRHVKQRLKISFDGLGDEEKQIFMDIACFFIGKPMSIAGRVWEGSGWNTQHALEMLKDKCLVEEIEILSLNVHEGLVLRMHDHLRDLGREMALELRPPHRLWRPKDLNYLESKGFKSILGKTHVRCFHSFFDESMSSQVTFFLGQPDICDETSASILWLELKGKFTQLSSIPSWICPQNVQCLKIKYGRLKTLWENRVQAPSQLKALHISETVLEKIPDFSGISDSLEEVFLDAQGWAIQGLSLLESLSMNLCSLCLRSSTLKGEHVSTKTEERTTCESLVIWNFKFTEEVAWNNRGMRSSVRAPMGGLEKLEISNEELVSKILISGIHYPSLEYIKLHCMENLTEVDLVSIKTLKCLDITNCKHLKNVSGISDLAKIELLNISQCPELEELSLGHLSCLERITIVDCKHLKSLSGSSDLASLVEVNGNDFMELVASNYFSSVSGVHCLRMLAQLNISECPELEELRLAHLSCLEKIAIGNCNNLKTVSGINNLANLIELEISDCGKLEFDCSCLSGMRCLERIIFDRNVKMKYFELDDCRNLKAIKYGCEELKELNFCDYSELEKLLVFGGLIFLERIRIDGCGEFKYLRLDGCQNLKSVSGNLEIGCLDIKKCSGLEEMPSFSSLSCLEKISIESCEKLQNIMLPTRLIELSVLRCRNLLRVSGNGDFIELKKLQINECSELEEMPSFSSLSCLEKISIKSCEKLQNIMLPTRLIELSVQGCSNLQRVSGNGDLTELKNLYINDCSNEELCLSSLSCVEKISIEYCRKLQNIMLPTRLILLSVQRCSNLQRVSGNGDLIELKNLDILGCPELEEFSSLSSLSCMEKISIVSCNKLQNIMLPTRLIELSVKCCNNLQSVSGNGDLIELKNLDIFGCRELEELPSFSSLSCSEKISIKSCEKLQNIMLPTRLIELSVQGCSNLQRVSGNGDLIELKNLYINDCSNEELCLSSLSCVEKISIVSCEKLQNIMLPTRLILLSVQRCSNLQRVSGNGDLIELKNLDISGCPELEELPSFSSLSSEKISIEYCEKLQNIMLPTRLIELSVHCCSNLQRVSGNGDLIELKNLNILGCPELEELPSFSSLSCVEKISIKSCEKLQNIMLPTRLIELSVHWCSNLQRVSGNGDLIELKHLYIAVCPELENISRFPSLSCMENIDIDRCGKLENMAGIEELQVSRIMKLSRCSNTVIRNCIHKLKSVPSKCVVVGRAVDGAESTLNEYLFSDAVDIGADAVTDIVQFGARDIDDELEKLEVSSKVILCCVVVIDDMGYRYYDFDSDNCVNFKVPQGEWIITIVGRDWTIKISNDLRWHGIMKKGFLVELKDGEEWKSVQVLNTVVDRLYHS